MASLPDLESLLDNATDVSAEEALKSELEKWLHAEEQLANATNILTFESNESESSQTPQMDVSLPGTSRGKRRGHDWSTVDCTPPKVARRNEVLTRKIPDDKTRKMMDDIKERSKFRKSEKDSKTADQKEKRKEDDKRRERAMKERRERQHEKKDKGSDGKSQKSQEENDKKKTKVKTSNTKNEMKESRSERAMKERKDKKSKRSEKKSDDERSDSGRSSASSKETLLDDDYHYFKVPNKVMLPVLERERQKQAAKEHRNKNKADKAAANKIDKANLSVVQCRKFGFRVSNRVPNGRDARGLCVICGKDYNNLGSHLKTHSMTHDVEKAKIFMEAQFTRSCRGPIHLPTLIDKLVEAKGSKPNMEGILKDAFSLVGVGTSQNESKCLPMYDLKKCFLKGHVLPPDSINDQDLEIHKLDQDDDDKHLSSSDETSSDSDESEDNDYHNSATFDKDILAQGSFCKRHVYGDTSVDMLVLTRLCQEPLPTRDVCLSRDDCSGKLRFPFNGKVFVISGRARALRVHYKTSNNMETVMLTIIRHI
ncbi:glutamic acid-rich protein-like [Thrips palmi]|uniref:Glutamic acid-rich protein-like n=1 Tax=Thrips palmi TaxID=161013 RepID=A0A6P9A764_THRPL|nr:glutamic acid-rich protein-like [Thrips palmi]XP_034253366.1 glutamic acid-rich protein-like [Thrips palmi]